eukprot:278049_1
MTNIISKLVNKSALMCAIAAGAYADTIHSGRHSSITQERYMGYNINYRDFSAFLTKDVHVLVGVLLSSGIALVAGGIVIGWYWTETSAAAQKENAIAKWVSLNPDQRVEKLVDLIMDNPDMLKQNPQMVEQFGEDAFEYMVVEISETQNQKAMTTLVKVVLRKEYKSDPRYLSNGSKEFLLELMVKGMIACKATGENGLLDITLGVMLKESPETLKLILVDLIEKNESVAEWRSYERQSLTGLEVNVPKKIEEVIMASRNPKLKMMMQQIRAQTDNIYYV